MESGHTNERPILRPSNHTEMMDYVKRPTEMTKADARGDVIEELTDHLLLWVQRSDVAEIERQTGLDIVFYDLAIKTKDGAVIAEMLIEDKSHGFVGIYDVDRGHAWFEDSREVLADQAVGDFMARWDLRARMRNARS